MTRIGTPTRHLTTSSLKLGLLGAATCALALSTAVVHAKPGKGGDSASAIHSESVDQAVAAATELGKSKSPAAAETLLDALAMGLPPQVASAALDALANHAKPGSFDIVVYYSHHRSPKVRSSALKALGALKDKRVAKIMLDSLGDSHKTVRAAAAAWLAADKNRDAVEPMLVLLQKGDEAAAMALASLANADMARSIGELIGKAPDSLLARCLGTILMRPDFKPEEARVELVKVIGKIPGNESLEQLTNYVSSLPEKPPRESRKEAETIIEARMGGQ